MGIAERLGFGGDESLSLVAARAAWRNWCAADDELAVVPDLDDLCGWRQVASTSDTNALFTRLAGMMAEDGAAVTVLTWLLLPGATRIAAELADLHPDIDGLVAGQLWVETSRAHELVDCRGVARAILRRTRSAVLGELGVGDAGERRDRAWAHAVRGDETLPPLTAAEPEPFADYTLLELLKAAFLDGAVVGFDLDLLWQLAEAADRLGAPAHRGRMGLTAPAVIEAFSEQMHLNARSVRRRAGEVLDRLQEYASVRDEADSLARWKMRHPPAVLSAREQMELAIEQEQAWWLMTGPERLAPEDAWARASRNVIPRHARRA
jgi:hypothetical protein